MPPDEDSNGQSPPLGRERLDLLLRRAQRGVQTADFSSMPTSELEARLEALLTSRPNDRENVDRLQVLVEEMHVYRCELEMQNRALAESQHELEQAVYRYIELYDSLPIAYITLTPTGEIIEANAAAYELLGVMRDQMGRSNFRRFLSPDEGLAFARHLANCVRYPERQTMEVMVHPMG